MALQSELVPRLVEKMNANTPSPSGPPQAEMLPQRPPPQVMRWAAWLLIGIFVAVAAASVLVPIPETVRCPFVLVPENGADPIQSPLLAIVQEVKVTEGQEVAQCAELFALRSDEIRRWQTQFEISQADLHALQKLSARLEENHQAEIGTKHTKLAQL